ncbi:MAG: DEAD/DEAH box helicase [Streptococcaceae bacterium]|jgi:ATP-dependent RNA helicase DeaD|nr:DEAD/DEAH box helicase [Streptococcaceae bacterium]
MTTFKELGLSEGTLETLAAIGYEMPTPIQEQTIKLALAGHDVIGQAQTGTGKTAAFGLPTIEKIVPGAGLQALIIAPTRELAVQNQEELFKFGKDKKLKVRIVFGGSSIERQIRDLKSGAEIVVGTPGRMVDLIKRKALDLSKITTLILDEADEMLNMGFLDDIEFIIAKTPEERQTLLFSATMPDAIKKIGVKFMRDPQHIKVKTSQMTADQIEQFFIKTKDFEKFDILTRLLDVQKPELAIIFGRTKRRVDQLTRGLKIRGYRAEGIHGDLDQSKRLSVLKDFKANHLDILVATDVAARGLDISGVTHVYNYDITQDQESYVHRIGRTGRAGKSGVSITFVTYNEMGYLRAIENLTKREMIGMKPPTKEEAYASSLADAKNSVNRDLTDPEFAGKLAKFDKDVDALLGEFDARQIAALLLQGRVKDPDTQEKVDIPAEKPLPANGGDRFRSFGNNRGGGRGNGGSHNRGGNSRDRDRRDGGRNRDDRRGNDDRRGGYRGKNDRNKDQGYKVERKNDGKRNFSKKPNNKIKQPGGKGGFVMRERGND